MPDAIGSPRDLLEFKLHSGSQMERTALEMLERLEPEATNGQLRRYLSRHAGETLTQIQRLEQVLGADADGTSARAIHPRLVDAVILAGAAETEHDEIAVYEALLAFAEALDDVELAARLRASLEQEQDALDELARVMRRTTRELVALAA
jgi:ferritin-like metal-binding protein YciE